MESKHLWSFGNLYTGYPWAVQVTDVWNCGEIHGPFSSESEADHYADRLALDSERWASVTVVRLETPQAGPVREWTGLAAERHIRVENGREVLYAGNWKLTR